MTLVQCDLSQAELRVMAALSGDTWMLAALQEGAGDFFDTHMMPVCFPGVVPTDAVHKKELRTAVKAVQYGLAFDRGAKAIGVALKMPPAQAQGIISNYLGQAPEFAQWREDIRYAATHPDARDILVSPFGRRFQSEVITKKNEKNIEREAMAFLPQATASDICLVTAVRVHNEIKARGSHIVALVHDAILVECPTPVVATEIGFMIQSEFRKTGEMIFGDLVPFLSEFSIGDSWGDLV